MHSNSLIRERFVVVTCRFNGNLTLSHLVNEGPKPKAKSPEGTGSSGLLILRFSHNPVTLLLTEPGLQHTFITPWTIVPEHAPSLGSERQEVVVLV